MAGDKYEIQVKNGSRWSLHSYKNSETESISEARQLLKQRIAEAVQVILHADNTQKTVFSEDENSIKKKAGINHIEDAPLCQGVDDFYNDSGRATIGSLLRDYCDQKIISPNELLHNDRAIEKLCDSSLFGGALDRVASLQAVKAGESEAERRNKLFDLVDEAKDRVRIAGYDDLPKGGLDGYIMGLGSLDDADVRFRFMVSLSKETLRAPSWEAKLAVLFDLVGDMEAEDLQETTVLLLDDILSEFLGMQTLIQEMLGHQPDRYNALNILTKICIGAYKPQKWDTVGLKRISGLTAKQPMKKSRKVLAELIEGMLRGRSPLTKGDIFEEKHAFKQLFPMFISKNGAILGGQSMAEALSMRATRSFNRDRNLDNPGDAINFILENLSAPILQMRYLLSLAHSRFGKDCGEIISNFIPTFMDGPEHLHDIVHYKIPTRRKIKVITDLQKSALGVEIPDEMNVKLVAWLDNLLFHFLDEERIVDKMDSPEETLFVRATQLLQFCGSGLLIEGKTLNWVRDRVQEHLRQPNFVEKFTAGVETVEKKEKIITQLHSMLKKAGLQQ